MKNPTLFILCGEAFSGKSTLSKKIAERYSAKVVGRDEIYFTTEKLLALDNTPEEDDDTLWKNMWPIVIQGVKNHLLLGNSVVVDDNCLYLRQRENLYSLAKEMGAKIILIYMNISAETLKSRKAKNKITNERHDVPSAWLAEDTQIFERPSKEENPIIYTEQTSAEDIFKQIDSLSFL